MNTPYLPVPPACLLALILLAGCASLQAGGYVQQGRNALQAGQPATAASYLRSAADLDPVYRTPDPLHESVLTYLGIAYYETGNLTEARAVLEKALANDKDDPMALLYLGLVRLRSSDEVSGRGEVESGLKGIHATLENLAADPYEGIFWDPGRRLRSEIEMALNGRLASAEFVTEAEWIGSQVDEEIEMARRDEMEDRLPTGGGGM